MARFTQCKATIQLGDDYGDNSITFRCGKGAGHDGEHIEMGQSSGCDYCFSWSLSNATSDQPIDLAGLRDSTENEEL